MNSAFSALEIFSNQLVDNHPQLPSAILTEDAGGQQMTHIMSTSAIPHTQDPDITRRVFHSQIEQKTNGARNRGML